MSLDCFMVNAIVTHTLTGLIRASAEHLMEIMLLIRRCRFVDGKEHDLLSQEDGLHIGPLTIDRSRVLLTHSTRDNHLSCPSQEGHRRELASCGDVGKMPGFYHDSKLLLHYIDLQFCFLSLQDSNEQNHSDETPENMND